MTLPELQEEVLASISAIKRELIDDLLDMGIIHPNDLKHFKKLMQDLEYDVNALFLRENGGWNSL